MTVEPEGSGSKVSYALEWEPLTFVGRLFGKKLAEQAGAAVEKRVLQAARIELRPAARTPQRDE